MSKEQVIKNISKATSYIMITCSPVKEGTREKGAVMDMLFHNINPEIESKIKDCVVGVFKGLGK